MRSRGWLFEDFPEQSIARSIQLDQTAFLRRRVRLWAKVRLWLDVRPEGPRLGVLDDRLRFLSTEVPSLPAVDPSEATINGRSVDESLARRRRSL